MKAKFKIGDLVAPLPQYEEILCHGESWCGVVLTGPQKYANGIFYYVFFGENYHYYAIEEDIYRKVGEDEESDDH